MINLIQNVMLLRSDMHDAWDSHEIAVNPDVGTFIMLTSFSEDTRSFLSLKVMKILLGESLNSTTSKITICVHLMNFFVTIFIKLC